MYLVNAVSVRLSSKTQLGLTVVLFFFLPVSLRANSVASGVTGDHRIMTWLLVSVYNIPLEVELHRSCYNKAISASQSECRTFIWTEGRNPDVFVCNVKAVKMYVDIQ